MEKLNVYERTGKNKGSVKQIRRQGDIPAVVYSQGKPGKVIAVKGDEFHTLLRTTPKGRLSTKVLTLVEEGKEQMQVILKDIQYQVTRYDIIHLDFEQIFDQVPVKVNIPVECTGVVDCVGIKLGGGLHQPIRKIKVSCLPGDIPEALELDIRNMKIKESRRLSDLQIPEGVRPLISLKEVVAVIAKR